MSTTQNREMCQEVEEALSAILDGTAPARLFDHVAECDDCRDLKHEAQAAADRVGGAGRDFRPADDFVEKLIGRLDAARPASSGPKAIASNTSVTSIDAPRSGAADSGHVVVRTANTEPGVESMATVFDPLAAAKAAEAEAESLRGEDAAKTTIDTQPSARAPEAGGSNEAKESSETKDPRAPAGRTIEAAPAPEAVQSEAPVKSSVAATTGHEPVSAPPKASDTLPSEPAAAQPSRAVEKAPIVPKAPAARAKVTPLRRPAYLVGGALAIAAAAAIGFSLKGGVTLPTSKSARGPWSGSVAAVSRASADKTGGLDACDASGKCAPVAGGAAIEAGATLRTDTRTRARITLADGTELSIDRGSEVALAKGEARSATVKRGTVVADVAHVEGAAAHLRFPRGDVEVLGTKLAVTATDDRASIEVARGAVRVKTDGGKTVDVRAGEEATIVGDAEPQVSSSTSLADTMEWSDAKPEEVDAPALRGVGELRARKPGQLKEKDHAVRLSKHAVKVRIVDVVARTEVDEVFTNDTDEELEGIYRFPLPPGAQIEKLALEVDGKLVEGAFVDRDKGAAIWRGVIQNAAPKAPKPREEIIWVPGPWRDPALLEWQRGGRFELKIFPIPKRGSRRVVLTYTQTVEQAGGIRRFTYPLAHDANGSTTIGSFDMDLQVLGLDRGVGMTTRGYELLNASVNADRRGPDPAGDGDRRTMHADNFVPAGDLTVEYALPDRDKEVTAWAYQAPVASTITPVSGKAKSAEEKAADAQAAAILDDQSPYVAITLRPRLPRWQEAKERVHAIVVDASRSMFGERFARATHLASAIVREMDRRDSFVLLACDTTCRPMTDGSAATPRPAAPGPSAAADVERFLGGLEPDGGSDLAASVAAARTAAGPLGGKELRVIYLGDGTPSVGPTRPAHLEAAVRGVVPGGDAAVIAVALGADADTTSLAALARGGGGVMVPYVPGQKVTTAALDVLGAAYGVVLRDVEVDLPAGLSQVTPARLDPIRAGGETILAARMTGGAITGDLKLRGKVAGERFEQTYPLRVQATTSAGNAFVPRLFAAAKIAEIERTGGESQKPVAIALSRRFSVASRFTSLLVLESEAMFKAFGLDRTAQAPAFTGEVAADSLSSESDSSVEKKDKAADELSEERASAGPKTANAYGDSAGGDIDGVGRLGTMGGGASMKPMEDAPADRGFAQAPAATAAAASPPASRSAPAKKQPAPAWEGQRRWEPPPPRARRFIPMRKVFDKHVSFAASSSFAANAGKLAAAESALNASPDSRDKTVQLFSLYSTLGRLGEAQELTAKWAGRDALDPDALLARADLAARSGDRPRAVRILGGLADVRPGDRAVQARLADLQDTAGNAALACEHRVALADLAPGDAKLVAAAMSCARAQGLGDLASALRFDAAEKVREALDKLAAAPQAPAAPRGEIRLSAEWTGGSDLDIGLIDATGKRTSWLGSASRATVTGRDVTSTHDEQLDISGLPQGSYVVEITRAGSGTDPVRGEVTVRFGGEVTKLPFSLVGPRAEAGTVRVFFTSRLVPL